MSVGKVGAFSFVPVPATAAWHHRAARSGFEVVYFAAHGERCRIEGWATAVEDGATWAVEYAIEVDAAWAARSAAIRGRSAAGFCSTRLEAGGHGHWLVDSKPARRLDGCLDVDLERSVMTNALPVRRLGLPVAAVAAAPAACVRAAGLAVERLERACARTTGEAACLRDDYTAPAFGFGARLVCDGSGLVLDCPRDRRPGRLAGLGGLAAASSPAPRTHPDTPACRQRATAGAVTPPGSCPGRRPRDCARVAGQRFPWRHHARQPGVV